MRATTGDTICYIQKYKNEGEEWKFRLVTSPITAIRIGQTATKVYSKRFGPIDVEELESNTEFFAPGVILVQEPFLDVGNLREIAERWIENEGWKYRIDELKGGAE